MCRAHPSDAIKDGGGLSLFDSSQNMTNKNQFYVVTIKIVSLKQVPRNIFGDTVFGQLFRGNDFCLFWANGFCETPSPPYHCSLSVTTYYFLNYLLLVIIKAAYVSQNLSLVVRGNAKNEFLISSKLLVFINIC